MTKNKKSGVGPEIFGSVGEQETQLFFHLALLACLFQNKVSNFIEHNKYKKIVFV